MKASLKQLRYFVAVADCRKVADAAKLLHVSQPALSAALAQLESIWDTQLFIRHKAQGVSLTTSGELLLKHTRHLLQQAHSLEDYVRGLNEQVIGDIKIGCFSTLGPLYIPQLLQQAQTDYPELNIQILEGDLQQLEANLLNGQLELALSYGLDQHSRIHYEPLADSLPYVLLPESHPLCEYDSLSLEQLYTEPFILLDLPHSGDYFLSLFQQIGHQPKIAYRSRSFEMTRCMVASGRGFSLLNQRPRTNQAYNGGTLRMIPLKSDQTRPLPIVIARHVDLMPSMRARLVTSLIHKIINQANIAEDNKN